MKNYAVLALMLACVLCLVACTSGTKPVSVEADFTEQPIIVSDSRSDVNDISVQVSGIYIYPDKTTLVVVWVNEAEESAKVNGTCWVERLENGEWRSCALKDNIVTTAAYELRPNKMENKSYTITEMYDISASGTYRFRSICNIDIGEEKHTDCSLWAEFVIE